MPTPHLSTAQLGTINAVNRAVTNYHRMRKACTDRRATALEVAAELRQMADSFTEEFPYISASRLHQLADKLTQ